MAKFGVLGLGEWGAALASHLGKSGHEVSAWTRNQETAREIQTVHRELTITHDVLALKDSEYILIALPGRALPDVVKILGQILSGSTYLISATKGLNPENHTTPLSTFLDQFKISPEKLSVISGPSFSTDLLNSRPLSIVAASSSETTAKTIARLFSNSTTRVYASTDPLGVELGGIMKNVIAIAAGVSDGLGFGASARAAVITRGLVEIVRLATKLGARQETLFGLSGLGDLVMTCSEDKSRNRRVGLELGKGKRLDVILKEINSAVEGVHTAKLLKQLGADYSVDLPITNQITRLLDGEVEAKQIAKELMERPLKNE